MPVSKTAKRSGPVRSSEPIGNTDDDTDNDDTDNEFPVDDGSADGSAFEFVFEEIPSFSRQGAGGRGRPATEWESILEPLTAHPGRSARFATFGTDEHEKRKAQNRVTAIKNRLNAVVEHEKWTIKYRRTANGNYCVYAQYDGEYSAEELAHVKALRRERGQKITAARAANKLARSESAE
ncbi:MAG: hypothetical protein ACREBW_00680 [Candidatus Micrarchaeaceae archaeon]